MTEVWNVRRLRDLILNPNKVIIVEGMLNELKAKVAKLAKISASRYVDLSDSVEHCIIAPDLKLRVTTKFGIYPEKTGGVTVDYHSEKIRALAIAQELAIARSHYNRISHDADNIGPCSSPQLLSSDPGKFHVPDKFGTYPEKTWEVTVDYHSEKIRELEIARSHYDRISHDADNIGHRSSPQLLSSDPGKFHAPDKLGFVQLLRSDSSYKEVIQNTGMSGAGGGKGKDGEPTKDDEPTLALKVRFSVEAVTPKFNASAKISLEMKSGSGSGSGSNSKPPPLPPMPTPLACKLYDCFLGVKKKFID